MADPLDVLPFTPTGISVIAALLFIIGYLFRLNAIDRRDAAARLSTLDAEAATRLANERADRKNEREWLTSFYENRLQRVTERYEQELGRRDEELAELRTRRSGS